MKRLTTTALAAVMALALTAGAQAQDAQDDVIRQLKEQIAELQAQAQKLVDEIAVLKERLAERDEARSEEKEGRGRRLRRLMDPRRFRIERGDGDDFRFEFDGKDFGDLRKQLEKHLGELGGGDWEGLRDRLMDRFKDMELDDFRGEKKGHSKGIRIEVLPDGGVRAEVREKVDGEERTKTYEADSMEELRREHPDLFGGDRFHFDIDTFRDRPAMPDAFEPAPRAPEPVGHDRLGVRVSVNDGGKMVVSEVLEGTLAARLGVENGDLLLKLNGADVSSPEDVQKALKATKAGGAVTLQVARGDKVVTLDAKKSGAEKPAKKKALRLKKI